MQDSYAVENVKPFPNSLSTGAGNGIAREMPHDIEIEQALLGAILVNNHAYERINGLIESTHFYDPLHASIFDAICEFAQSGKIANPVTLKTFFENFPPVTDKLTVPQYLTRLAASAVTIVNAREYAKIIVDFSKRRDLVALGEDLFNAAHNAVIGVSPAILIEEAESRLFAIAERAKEGGEAKAIGVYLKGAVEHSAKAFERGGGLAGLSSGFVDLDKKLGGLQASDLIALGGRPSIGKTAFATNIVYNVSRSDETTEDGEIKPFPVHFFSQEMSGVQLALRLIGEHSHIASDRLRRGDYDTHEMRHVMETAKRLSGLPIWIDETGALSISQLASRARRVKRQHGTRLIVVDYLQLMRANSRRENRVQDITEITMSLKALAKELNVPVIALSQLSREVEKRNDKRPQLADLRESGSIEQDADVVMFVYRDEYYIEREKPDEGDFSKYAEWQEKLKAAKGKAEVIIAKNRQGETGVVNLAFDGKLTKFSNLAKERGQ